LKRSLVDWLVQIPEEVRIILLRTCQGFLDAFLVVWLQNLTIFVHEELKINSEFWHCNIRSVITGRVELTLGVASTHYRKPCQVAASLVAVIVKLPPTANHQAPPRPKLFCSSDWL